MIFSDGVPDHNIESWTFYRFPTRMPVATDLISGMLTTLLALKSIHLHIAEELRCTERTSRAQRRVLALRNCTYPIRGVARDARDPWLTAGLFCAS